MFHVPVREHPCVSWLYVALWTLSIYLTIPLARMLQSLVVEHLDRAAFMWVTVVWVLLCGVAALVWLGRHGHRVSWAQYIWLAGAAGVYLGGTWQLRANPEEALHFVQYGVLGLLVYRALTHHVRDWTIYCSAAVICGLLGTLDEFIQWVTPRRFWDFRDVGLNFLGAVVMQGAIALGLRPGLIRGQRATVASLRLCARLTAGFVILLGLCASSTPQRWLQMAQVAPRLEFLAFNDHAMADYGHRHAHPDIGVFVSRLSLEELEREDRLHGAEHALVLKRYREDADYQEFLQAYPPSAHPFVHEARVRLFRRDRHLETARRARPGSPGQIRQITVAVREDRILQRFFPHTYQAAGLHPSLEDRRAMDQWHDQVAVYVSPVGGELFTRVSEGQIWLLVLAAVVVLEGGQRVYARRRRG